MNYTFAITKRMVGTELERHTTERWITIKPKIKYEILYETEDVEDPKLKEFNLETIIWSRVFNPITKDYEKVKVPFTPDNVYLMTEKAEEITASKLNRFKAEEQQKKNKIEERKNTKEYKNQLQQYKVSQEYIEEKIPYSLSIEEAFRRWKQMNFFMPAPKIIAEYKKRRNIKWYELQNFVNKNY